MNKEFRSPAERAAWEKAAGMERITLAGLADAGVAGGMVGQLLRRWEEKGWLVRAPEENKCKVYVHAGQSEPVYVKGCKSAEDAMWIVMQRYPTFTPVDLSAIASIGEIEVSLKSARSYCRKLLKSGFLRVRQTAVPRKGREAVYQLMNNTGARAPHPKTVRGIFDPNTNEFHPIYQETRP